MISEAQDRDNGLAASKAVAGFAYFVIGFGFGVRAFVSKSVNQVRVQAAKVLSGAGVKSGFVWVRWSGGQFSPSRPNGLLNQTAWAVGLILNIVH